MAAVSARREETRLEFPRETGLILRCAGKAGNPFQTTQGNRPTARDQKGPQRPPLPTPHWRFTAWEARGEWGGVGVLDATSDAAQIWVRSSGDLGEQILRNLTLFIALASFI